MSVIATLLLWHFSIIIIYKTAQFKTPTTAVLSHALQSAVAIQNKSIRRAQGDLLQIWTPDQ